MITISSLDKIPSPNVHFDVFFSRTNGKVESINLSARNPLGADHDKVNISGSFVFKAPTEGEMIDDLEELALMCAEIVKIIKGK